MAANVIDRRAYKPLCVYCHDTGCPMCEPQRAALFQNRLIEADYAALIEECKSWLGERIAVNRGTYIEMKMPRTEAELLDLIMNAMIYGVMRERKRQNVDEMLPEAKTEDRFKRLDWRDE